MKVLALQRRPHGRTAMGEQQPPSLWETLDQVFHQDVGEIDLGDGMGTVSDDPDAGTWAAIIRAVRDRIVPEEPKPSGMQPAGYTYSAMEIRRNERQRLRSILTDEADSAERAS